MPEGSYQKVQHLITGVFFAVFFTISQTKQSKNIVKYSIYPQTLEIKRINLRSQADIYRPKNEASPAVSVDTIEQHVMRPSQRRRWEARHRPVRLSTAELQRHRSAHRQDTWGHARRHVALGDKPYCAQRSV